MGPTNPHVVVSSESPSDFFAAWQLADELAGCAERLVCDAFSASANGHGTSPSLVQLEVARKLRVAATDRLRIALEAFEEPRADPGPHEAVC